jgi:hypothetical protein
MYCGRPHSAISLISNGDGSRIVIEHLGTLERRKMVDKTP